tara:strand:- start:1269 stop:1931 length:663 start_codon:yes stop_codon:yes gene_type:complete
MSSLKKKLYRWFKILPQSFITLLYQSINLRRNFGRTASIKKLVSKHFPPQQPDRIAVDLGCGKKPKNPFCADTIFGVDIREDLELGILKADLSKQSIPFDSNSLDFCTAFDFIEHMPRIIELEGKTHFCFIELMNEIYRVLKPGGILLHATPAYPAKEAFQDPTHVNIITEDTFPYYFCLPYLWASELGYGFRGAFELVDQAWLNNTHIVSILKAIKNGN